MPRRKPAMLVVHPESERRLKEHLKTPEGKKALDDLMRILARAMADEHCRSGEIKLPPELEAFAPIAEAVRKGIILDSRIEKTPKK